MSAPSCTLQSFYVRATILQRSFETLQLLGRGCEYSVEESCKAAAILVREPTSSYWECSWRPTRKIAMTELAVSMLTVLGHTAGSRFFETGQLLITSIHAASVISNVKTPQLLNEVDQAIVNGLAHLWAGQLEPASHYRFLSGPIFHYGDESLTIRRSILFRETCARTHYEAMIDTCALITEDSSIAWLAWYSQLSMPCSGDCVFNQLRLKIVYYVFEGRCGSYQQRRDAPKYLKALSDCVADMIVESSNLNSCITGWWLDVWIVYIYHLLNEWEPTRGLVDFQQRVKNELAGLKIESHIVTTYLASTALESAGKQCH